jgi:transposase
MERIPTAVYTKELREEAVKLVTEDELSIPDVGRRLSIAASTIRYWAKASPEDKLQGSPSLDASAPWTVL